MVRTQIKKICSKNIFKNTLVILRNKRRSKNVEVMECESIKKVMIVVVRLKCSRISYQLNEVNYKLIFVTLTKNRRVELYVCTHIKVQLDRVEKQAALVP